MRTFLLLAAAVLVASTAHAQNPTPAPTTGPLVLERIHDAWIVAPDFKVTDLDDRTGELAGAYGGRVFDNTLLVGGAGYWLTNEARDFKMAYGGLLVGWQSREFGRIRFGGRGLAGGGTATLGFDVTSASFWLPAKAPSIAKSASPWRAALSMSRRSRPSPLNTAPLPKATAESRFSKSLRAARTVSLS